MQKIEKISDLNFIINICMQHTFLNSYLILFSISLSTNFVFNRFSFSFFWNNRAYARKKLPDKVNYGFEFRVLSFSLKNVRQYQNDSESIEFRKYVPYKLLYRLSYYILHYTIGWSIFT